MLIRCLILNGSIENDLDLGQDQLQNLDGIRDAEAQIENAKREFEKNKQMVVYNQAMYHLGNITENLKSEYPFGFILYKTIAGNPKDYLEFNYLLNLINENEIIKNKKEKFDFSCSLNLVCDNSGGFSPSVEDEQQKCFHPTKCIPSQRNWINEDSTLELYATIIKDLKEVIQKANDLEIVNGGYKKNLEDLSEFYGRFLDGYIETLKVANTTIKKLTTKLNEYTGEDGGMFSFINCSFIKTNLKIILKYLKEALGGNLYTIGVCLILVGCSLILSISFTILLIIVINADIDSKKKTT